MKTLALLLMLTGSAAAAEPVVTLHEKDGDVREILKSMQKQCGIRNMVIDKDVAGKATLYFKEVPCSTAFKVVFRVFGLAGQPDPTITVVEKR